MNLQEAASESLAQHPFQLATPPEKGLRLFGVAHLLLLTQRKGGKVLEFKGEGTAHHVLSSVPRQSSLKLGPENEVPKH